MSNVITPPGASESNDRCAEPKVDPAHKPRQLLSRLAEHEKHGLVVFASGDATRLLIDIETYLKAAI